MHMHGKTKQLRFYKLLLSLTLQDGTVAKLLLSLILQDTVLPHAKRILLLP